MNLAVRRFILLKYDSSLCFVCHVFLNYIQHNAHCVYTTIQVSSQVKSLIKYTAERNVVFMDQSAKTVQHNIQHKNGTELRRRLCCIWLLLYILYIYTYIYLYTYNNNCTNGMYYNGNNIKVTIIYVFKSVVWYEAS